MRQYEKTKYNWFDTFCMYAALAMVIGGMGVLGYGLFNAVHESVTKKRAINKETGKVKIPTDTIMLNAAAEMQKKSR